MQKLSNEVLTELSDELQTKPYFLEKDFYIKNVLQTFNDITNKN